MFENIENLKLIDIIESKSVKSGFFKERFAHGLVFKVSGESIYHFGNKNLSLKAGEVIYIPKGTDYSVNRITADSDYIAINFDGTVDDNTPFVCSMEGYPDINYVYEHLVKLWLFGSNNDRFKCYSQFYSVLSFVLGKLSSPYSYKSKFARIETAVKYLHAHIFDCDLKVEDCYFLCGISDTYFRKIFKSHFGVTVQEYIINKRMSKARSIIVSEDYDSINSVALSVGYSDPLYFSRVFKAKYGVCPSEYARNF